MSKLIDIERLSRALASAPAIRFALLFGSARTGSVPQADSDVDVGIYLDHKPEFEEQADLLGLIQDAVQSDKVDLVFLNLTKNAVLRREALKGRLLLCRDREAYADFFSLADRQGRDEEDRIARAWALRRET
jgi:predicted nucleotidyltransferase